MVFLSGIFFFLASEESFIVPNLCFVSVKSVKMLIHLDMNYFYSNHMNWKKWIVPWMIFIIDSDQVESFKLVSDMFILKNNGVLFRHESLENNCFDLISFRIIVYRLQRPGRDRENSRHPIDFSKNSITKDAWKNEKPNLSQQQKRHSLISEGSVRKELKVNFWPKFMRIFDIPIWVVCFRVKPKCFS